VRRINWPALVVFLTLCSPGNAREPTTAAACATLSAPAAQSGCLEKLAMAADARLNETYRRAVTMIEKSGSDKIAEWKTELKSAQQPWIAFRDADCGALVGYEWSHGTGMGSAMESCLLQKTEQRTRDLRDRYINRR
jgi:uncharacterized protein YecT (DUF1311 family)